MRLEVIPGHEQTLTRGSAPQRSACTAHTNCCMQSQEQRASQEASQLLPLLAVSAAGSYLLLLEQQMKPFTVKFGPYCRSAVGPELP